MTRVRTEVVDERCSFRVICSRWIGIVGIVGSVLICERLPAAWVWGLLPAAGLPRLSNTIVALLHSCLKQATEPRTAVCKLIHHLLLLLTLGICPLDYISVD